MTDFIIRPAVESDLPACIDMGEKFHATTDYAAYVPYDRPTVDFNAHLCLNTGVLLVAESAGKLIGVVGLILAPSIFNNAVLCAYEAIWYVDPEVGMLGAGKALALAIEPACKAKGVRAIHMLHLQNSPPQAAAIYERMGFHHAESVYIKVI